MTLTYELDLDRVKMNQISRLKVISFERSNTETNGLAGLIAVPGRPKCSGLCRSREMFLPRPQDQWRGIVISMSVYVSVCLSVREHIYGTKHAIFTNFSVHGAYGRGSVILRQGDEIPKGK